MLLGNGYELSHHKRWWSAIRQLHKTAPVQPPARGFCVFHDGRLAAGVSIFETEGSGCLFEFLWAAPYLSLRQRHRAVEHVVLSSLVYCRAIGKQAIMLNSVKGLRMMVQRFGIAGRSDLEVLASVMDE